MDVILLEEEVLGLWTSQDPGDVTVHRNVVVVLSWGLLFYISEGEEDLEVKDRVHSNGDDNAMQVARLVSAGTHLQSAMVVH